MSEADVRDTRRGGVDDRIEAGAHRRGDDPQRRASQAVEGGKAKLSEQLERGTSGLGSQARSFGSMLRQSTEQLRREGGETEATRLSTGIAEQLERAGRYLEQTRGSALLGDAEEFARRRPWVVAGTAAVVGLMASRLLKASSDRRYMQSSAGRGWPRPSESDVVSTRRDAALPSGV